MNKRKHKLWLKIAVAIADSIPSKPQVKCPECSSDSTIDYQHIGDPATRIGYMLIWCNSCLNGIHISRVIIPENAKMLPLDVDEETIKKRIPSFKQN